MFGGLLGRQRRRGAPTLADSRYNGTWRPQGAALGGATGHATLGPERELWGSNRASDARAPDYRVMLSPIPGVSRPMTGGAVMSRSKDFDTTLGRDGNDGLHNAILNRPNVMVRDLTVLPWEGAPVVLWAQRPVTDADNTPDVC